MAAVPSGHRPTKRILQLASCLNNCAATAVPIFPVPPNMTNVLPLFWLFDDKADTPVERQYS
jgi:hypothetical protein